MNSLTIPFMIAVSFHHTIMPVETRRGRQSTLAFPSRKTQTPSRTLLTLKGEEKNLNGLKKDHCRSKSLSSLSSRLIPVNREPSFTSLADRLDGMLSPRKRSKYIIEIVFSYFLIFSDNLIQ